MYSRRQFGKVALAALPMSLVAAKIESKIHGVQLGLHTYSFSTSPRAGVLDVVIRCMADIGLGECILDSPQIEPAEFWDIIRPIPGSTPGAAPDAAAQARAREQLGQWRMSVSLDHFREIRKKFEAAGIEIYGLGATPGPSDAEVNRAFDIALALGARILTFGGTLPLARRVAPIAGKRGMMVGLQGRPNLGSTDADQIAKPENYDAAVQLSKNLWIDLDIGDATGAGFDAFRFVQDHHDRMHSVFLKDRRKDRTSVPWGEGDTPVKQILQLIRDKQYPIRCYVDCDYKSNGDRAAEVKRCFEYAKAALG
jgi:sugar phosphate isomerase/epimerase